MNRKSKKDFEAIERSFKDRHANIMVAGIQQEVAPKDTVTVSNFGIHIDHHDPSESWTFIPWSNVGIIRTYDPKASTKKAGQGSGQ